MSRFVSHINQPSKTQVTPPLLPPPTKDNAEWDLSSQVCLSCLTGALSDPDAASSIVDGGKDEHQRRVRGLKGCDAVFFRGGEGDSLYARCEESLAVTVVPLQAT